MATVLQELDELVDLLLEARRKITSIEGKTILELDHKAETFERMKSIGALINTASDAAHQANLRRIYTCSHEELDATPLNLPRI